MIREEDFPEECRIEGAREEETIILEVIEDIGNININGNGNKNNYYGLEIIIELFDFCFWMKFNNYLLHYLIIF